MKPGEKAGPPEMVICGNRKSDLSDGFRLRTAGPPRSTPQNHKANATTFVTQMLRASRRSVVPEDDLPARRARTSSRSAPRFIMLTIAVRESAKARIAFRWRATRFQWCSAEARRARFWFQAVAKDKG